MGNYIKHSFLLLAVLFSVVYSNAQTFTGTGGTIPNVGNASFPINVTGVGIINGTYGLAGVCFSINHNTPDADLEIILMAPDGTNVPLSMQNGGNGQNFVNTCFSGVAATPIRNGVAPFTGTFLPDAYLGTVNNGQDANNTWRLYVNDRRTNSGTASLLTWSITFNNSPAPLPPVLPSCSVTLPSGTTCAAATAICDFSGLCGNTNGTTVSTWTGSGLNGCFGLENNTFLKFIASASTASFSVWVPTYSAGTYINSGIQMLFFSGTCGSGAVTTYGCYPHILAYGDPAKPVVNLVSATGLTPGNTYYLMIDGFGGDKCNFVIEANQGLNIVNISPTAASICQGQNVNLTASGGGGTFSWSPAGGLNQVTGAVVNASPATTTTYTVTSIVNGVCPATKDVTVTVNAYPVITAQPSTAIQSVCMGGVATTLSVTANAGSGTLSSYQWYSNTTASNSGGVLIPGATASSYTPSTVSIGTVYYYCVIANSNSCNVTSNVSGGITINPAMATPAASVTTQPTCTVNTGIITVTAPVGPNIQYSSGGSYQASGTFSGLAPGSYNITAKDIISGCVSAIFPLTVNNAPSAPAAPVATVTAQPTCTVNTGTIAVTAPVGGNIQYSIGGTYQTSGTFAGLAPGSYNIIAKDVVTGCVSSMLPLTINAAPGTPATPAATVTVQPTCTVNTGTISVTAPVGANIQYSIGGTYQASGSFAGLAPGSYNITAKDIVTGCVSSAFPLTVNAVPAAPATPTATVTTQPTCTISTGIIQVTAPAGPNLQYSNGGAYQSNGTFTGMAPGNYNITVKDIVTGCVSASLPLTVNTVPGAPATPTATVTVQPNCTVNTGTIAISAPIGANIEYSTGGAYQGSGTFTGLIPGTYNITAKDGVTGCVSAIFSLTVNAVPVPPATPTASVTAQPNCLVGTGTISVTAPVGANIQYSAGGAFQSSGIFTGLPPGNYNVSVKDISTGCISANFALVVNTAPGIPATPAATVTVQPACTVSTGTILVNSPVGANIQYSVGGVYQASSTFTGLTPGSYNITAKDMVSGCISAVFPLTVNAIPVAPSTPAAAVTAQPTCTIPTGTIQVTSPVGSNLQYSIGGVYQGSPIFPGLVPNSYFITAKDVSTGCVSAAMNLIVNAVPLAPAIPVASVTAQPTCTVPTGTITISAPIGPNIQYSISGTYQVSGIFAGLVSNTYLITAKDVATGCVSAIFPLTVNAIPGVPAAPVTTAGSRCGAGVVNLTATGTGTLNWYSDVALSNLVATGSTFSPTVNATTLYYVTATGASCASPATSVSATVKPLPFPYMGKDTSICPGDKLVLNPGAFSNYTWQDNSTRPTYTVSTAGLYTVSVTAANGCQNTAKVEVAVLPDCSEIYFPNAFTPNGDLKNDRFGPLPLSNLSQLKKYALKIYNRYGQLVFSSTDPYDQWTGTFLGTMLAGSYAWYAEYLYKGVIPVMQKGNIILIK